MSVLNRLNHVTSYAVTQTEALLVSVKTDTGSVSRTTPDVAV